MSTELATPGHRVAITAMGCISPLARNRPGTHQALIEGHDAISPVHSFDVSHCQCKTAGQIPEEWLVPSLGKTPAKFHRWHRSSKMLLVALQEALSQHPEFQPERSIFGTTSGGMSFGEKFFRACLEKSSLRHAASWIAEYTPTQPIFDALAACGISAPCQVLSNACASGTNALGQGFLAIASGQSRHVLCGGYDALAQLLFAGFESLKAMTPHQCCPFDHNRSGLVLGEGAAVFFLENLEQAHSQGHPLLAEVLGYGTALDSYHFTSPHPDGRGARLAMERTLKSAGLPAKSIDYVNAHGTGTLANDFSEAHALLEVVPQAFVSSTKSMMGHALGAAGAIEAAFCIHALQSQILPPNLHYQSGGGNLRIVSTPGQSASIHTVLSNSFGFGGANACIALQAL